MATKSDSTLPKGIYWKRGELWARVKRHGRRFDRPAHTTSIREALSVQDGLLREVLAGEKSVPGAGNTTCSELLAAYLDRLKRKTREGCDTLKIATGTVEKHVIPFFGKMKAIRVTRATLEKYHDAKIKTHSQVSVNRQLGYLRSAFILGAKDKQINHSQIPDFSTTIIRSAEEDNARSGIITQEQYEKLLPLLDVHVRPLFVLTWNTGVRPSEAFRLTWEQVDWNSRLISVHARQAKIGKQRYLPMRQRVYEEMQSWQAYLKNLQPHATLIFTHPVTGQAMTKNDYRASWAKACKAAGYAHDVESNGRKYIKTDLLFYDARRAFRTYIPEEINVLDGKSVMGQTQDTTYGRYHVEPQRSALRILEAQEKIVVPAVAKTNGDSLESRLLELKKWFDSGLLDEAEYKEQKRIVLTGN
jgi:integrase